MSPGGGYGTDLCHSRSLELCECEGGPLEPGIHNAGLLTGYVDTVYCEVIFLDPHELNIYHIFLINF